MKKQIGRAFSLVLVAALMVSFVVPVHADVSDAVGYMVGEFWDAVTGNEADAFGTYWGNVAGYLVGEECPSSPDKYHHGKTPVGGIGSFASGGTDDNGRFVWHVCDYCQKQFKAYASDLQQSYENQVSELPATGYNSAGRLIWQPIFESDIVDVPKWITSSTWHNGYEANGDGVFYSDYIVSYSFQSVMGLCVQIKFPFNGSYRVLSGSPKYEASLVSKTGEIVFQSAVYSDSDYPDFSYRKANSKLEFHIYPVISGGPFVLYNISAILPVFEVIPDAAPSGDTYNITSRPTSITGDYGIIGDNGQIIKVEGDRIINETNNTYYNPATGETHTFSDWSYNYEDRSYTVTTEDGGTATITYGDGNVTIVEGDTTYNVYYLVDGSGSGGGHVHEWYQTGAKQGNCITPAQRTYTCSECYEQYTETDPAPGHSWLEKQTVPTQYDDTGTLVQEGYTIYECERCGEQSKTTNMTGPPSSGGSDSGSSGGVFSGIFGLLVDFLGFFWNTFHDFVGEGVKGFLAALMDGTSSIFGLLNPFSWGG